MEVKSAWCSERQLLSHQRARSRVDEYVKRRMNQITGTICQQLVDEGSYPYPTVASEDPVERAEALRRAGRRPISDGRIEALAAHERLAARRSPYSSAPGTVGFFV